LPVGPRFAAWAPEQLQIIPTTIDALEVVFAVDAPALVAEAACEPLVELDEPHAPSARATSAQASTLDLSRVTTSSLLI
jgi:hypothetical protein